MASAGNVTVNVRVVAQQSDQARRHKRWARWWYWATLEFIAVVLGCLIAHAVGGHVTDLTITEFLVAAGFCRLNYLDELLRAVEVAYGWERS